MVLILPISEDFEKGVPNKVQMESSDKFSLVKNIIVRPVYV